LNKPGFDVGVEQRVIFKYAPFLGVFCFDKRVLWRYAIDIVYADKL